MFLRWTVTFRILISLFVSVVPVAAQSGGLTVEGRPVQVHGFISQAFSVSNVNNYLTMHTSGGSFAFTDFGANVSMQVTDKFRIGAQLYDRNVGQLGKWHPQLDWASADYRFADWFGVRAGKIKTVLGLYNDTQDQEALHTWALLPQSVYAVDLRSNNIAHVGLDLYGNVDLKRVGGASYTVYGGSLPDDPYGGFFYGSKAYGNNLKTLGGKVFGIDLRWNTPVPGLLVGGTYNIASADGNGTDYLGRPYRTRTRAYHLTQGYVEYLKGSLRIDGEFRQIHLDDLTDIGTSQIEVVLKTRSVYGSVSYRLSKRFEIGSYYSRFYLNGQGSSSDPRNHIFDKVATVRLDLTNHWDVKVEGHFINGYGASDAFQGFYLQDNPGGFKPNTNLLVIRTGIEF